MTQLEFDSSRPGTRAQLWVGVAGVAVVGLGVGFAVAESTADWTWILVLVFGVNALWLWGAVRGGAIEWIALADEHLEFRDCAGNTTRLAWIDIERVVYLRQDMEIVADGRTHSVETPRFKDDARQQILETVLASVPPSTELRDQKALNEATFDRWMKRIAVMWLLIGSGSAAVFAAILRDYNAAGWLVIGGALLALVFRYWKSMHLVQLRT